ncbi:MAG TPA: hypothetical protein VGG68_11400 [Caulobacteraceae bacterium]
MGVAPAIAARRRTPVKRLAGADGNQARLRRLVLQRQSTDDPAQRPDPNQEIKPTPKPWFPLGSDWKFDPTASHPDAPAPWDKPGSTGGPGGSLEDLHGGLVDVFGKKKGPGAITGPMPPCSALHAPDWTAQAPKYRTWQDYDNQRKLWHLPPAKDVWPQLSPEDYNAAVETCKQQEAKQPPPSTQPTPPLPTLPMPPPSPKGDFPGPTLPPGQKYA